MGIFFPFILGVLLMHITSVHNLDTNNNVPVIEADEAPIEIFISEPVTK